MGIPGLLKCFQSLIETDASLGTNIFLGFSGIFIVSIPYIEGATIWVYTVSFPGTD